MLAVDEDDAARGDAVADAAALVVFHGVDEELGASRRVLQQELFVHQPLQAGAVAVSHGRLVLCAHVGVSAPAGAPDAVHRGGEAPDGQADDGAFEQHLFDFAQEEADGMAHVFGLEGDALVVADALQDVVQRIAAGVAHLGDEGVFDGGEIGGVQGDVPRAVLLSHRQGVLSE